MNQVEWLDWSQNIDKASHFMPSVHFYKNCIFDEVCNSDHIFVKKDGLWSSTLYL